MRDRREDAGDELLPGAGEQGVAGGYEVGGSDGGDGELSLLGRSLSASSRSPS